ncbi:protein Star-like [Artemia franciscana]|uniref:Methyltransferase FkbM domain-containing protein n=1 Tax=Artemia franciscana TaxID=6661 RepID=A0AA88I520_ARTSF|nr:hypothetical protein QYM36_004254 [Artemia franciscana]
MGYQIKVVLVFALLSFFGIFIYFSINESGSEAFRSKTEERPSELFGPSVELHNPFIITRLRNELMHLPSENGYQLSQSDHLYDPSMGQSKAILKALDYKTRGFFIECGALDGETRSNTLYMERSLNWSGILIEGDPKNFELLKKKNRRAHSFPVCLSPFPYPEILLFEQQFNIGKITDTAKSNTVQVECYPLSYILLAVNQTSIDYFSLDVEGNELKVLKNVPWDNVDIKTLSVEFVHDKEGKVAIKEYMESVGYDLIDEISRDDMLANDFIFLKR